MSKRLLKLKNIQEANQRLLEGTDSITNEDKITVLRMAAARLEQVIALTRGSLRGTPYEDIAERNLITDLMICRDSSEYPTQNLGILQYIDKLENGDSDFDDDDDMPGFEGTNDSLNDLRIR
jgi:hypothetical protein